MKKTNKSSYTKSCHSRKLLSGIFDILSSYLKKEESFLTNNTYVEDPRQNSSGMTALLTMARAFTLMELMVAVIIIAVLAAVAVPQYKKAVLKSRFSTLLPVAQRIKSAQETYYLGNHYYSDNLNELDVDVPGTITGATVATYGDNITAKISAPSEEEEERDAYSYVLASKAGLNNNYIVYQEHSKNYPGNIHCEAKNEDDEAQWLCEKGLNGQKVEEGSITPGYTTYIIEGSLSDGTFLKECKKEKELEDTSCACGS